MNNLTVVFTKTLVLLMIFMSLLVIFCNQKVDKEITMNYTKEMPSVVQDTAQDSVIVSKTVNDPFNEPWKLEVQRNRLEETKNRYVERFAKDVPNWDWMNIIETRRGIHYASADLMSAVEIGMPFHTREEELTLLSQSENIKVIYNNRFGIPITEQYLFMVRVHFKNGRDNIVLHRIIGGVSAMYVLDRERNHGGRTNLDIEEWLVFLNTLYRYINTWEERYTGPTTFSSHDYWQLCIYLLNGNIIRFEGSNAYPPNWDEFMGLMDGMKAKIERRQ